MSGNQGRRPSVIPVIDLQGGVVVRGVAGRRDAYRPLVSGIAADARPASVARGLAERFAFRQVYVADLDAIAGAPPNWAAFREIAAAGLSLLIDAGVAHPRRAERLVRGSDLGAALAGVIVGLESVRRPHLLPGILQAVGDTAALFSIDLMHGRPMNAAALWRTRSPEQIADVAVSAGFRRLVVLDLAAVGVDEGPAALDACRLIRGAHREVELISGGGVREASDLRAFGEAGCNAVLVASALHDGRLRREDVMRGGA